MIYDVIIIGGGAAGLFGALSVRGKNVLLIEKNKEPGKKILITGAGQCNYTNNCGMNEFLKMYGDKGRFLKTALYNFSNNDAVKFFNDQGIKSFVREDNKVFPESLKAKDIRNALVSCCLKNGVEFSYDCAVNDVRIHEDGYFLVKTSNGAFAALNIILATGGMSYPHTGSSGDGYKFAQNLGHSIKKPVECLTPVHVENYEFSDVSGISFENINISLWRNNRKINDFKGDFLFTHMNISGPVILNNSRYMESGDILKINFTQYDNKDEFKNNFENLILSSGKLCIKTIMKNYSLPKRFIDKILIMSNVDGETLCSQLHKEKRKRMTELLSNHPFKIDKLGGFHIAMATKGGVSTDEINQKTMESKIIPHLYFAGEIIDYDGDTGGFNLQAAFSTGKLAAESINNYSNRL